MTKTLGNKVLNVAKNSWKVLPVGSLVAWNDSSILKGLGHAAYSIFGLVFLGNAIDKGTLNPIEMKEIWLKKGKQNGYL